MTDRSPDHPKSDDRTSSDAARRWTALVALLGVAARRLRTSLAEQISPHDFGESEFSLLWACYQPTQPPLEASGISQTEISAALEISPASVSALVEQLRRGGLLSGERSAVDRRRQLWRLTPQGRELVERVLAELNAWAFSLDGAIGADRQKALDADLQTLLRVRPARSEAESSDRGATVPLSTRRGAAA